MYSMTIRPGAGPATSDLWTFQPYTGGTVSDQRTVLTKTFVGFVRATRSTWVPYQKPVGLLKRIIEASSNPGDLVLDPFCGCGTTIEAAERLKRSWIGIDISPFAIQLIKRRRIEGAFPALKMGVDFQIDGLPTTLAGAKMMAEQDKKAFEIWAVSTIDGIPNEEEGATKASTGASGSSRMEKQQSMRRCR